jgi:hypothetical protein
MSRRIDNWPKHLQAFLDERRAMPFAWGSNDCCLFAADCIKVLTGLDLAEDLRGTYDSDLSAARVLKEFEGVEQIAVTRCAEHGFSEVPVSFAQRGDLLLVVTERGPTLAICTGIRCTAPTESGRVETPTLEASRCWHIS